MNFASSIFVIACILHKEAVQTFAQPHHGPMHKGPPNHPAACCKVENESAQTEFKKTMTEHRQACIAEVGMVA